MKRSMKTKKIVNPIISPIEYGIFSPRDAGTLLDRRVFPFCVQIPTGRIRMEVLVKDPKGRILKRIGATIVYTGATTGLVSRTIFDEPVRVQNGESVICRTPRKGGRRKVGDGSLS